MSEQSGQGAYQRLRDAVRVGEVALIIGLGCLFFYYPAAVIRGEMSSLRGQLVGYLGIGFWLLAIVTFAGQT